MLYGISIKESMLGDEEFLGAIAKHFNCYYPEKALKMDRVCPRESGYDFALADRIVDLAVNNKAKVRGHALMWRLGVPKWLEQGNYSPEEIWTIIKDYFAATIGRYKGQIEFWDVANEAIAEDGSILNCFWSRSLGKDWIIEAFKLARQFTDAELFYCDFRIKNHTKWQVIYDLVVYLHEQGLCDGVAMQLHSNSLPPAPLESMVYWISKFRSRGLIVHAPEIVVWSRMGFLDHLLVQASYFDVCKVCVEHGVSLLGFWSVFAKYQWHWINDRTSVSWLFNENYQPLSVWGKIKSFGS